MGSGEAMSRNVEIKCYCPDFKPIKGVLRVLGARHVVTKRQVDTYFRVPADGPTCFRRLKLREQLGKAELIGYSDTYTGGSRDVDYRVVPADKRLKEVLVGALGVSAIVTKRRELWTLPRTLFNLDTIDGLGKVFEAEVVLRAGETSDEIERYRELFEPYLGERIEGSNEDLLRI
jgi:adenylate cyclase class IV